MKTAKLLILIALTAISFAACNAGDKGAERTPDSVQFDQGDSAASGMGTPATSTSDSSSGDTTQAITDTTVMKGGRP